jgi:hypothetical protein
MTGDKFLERAVREFFFTTMSKLALGPTQPLTQWTLGVKRPGHEIDHSSTSSAEVKNVWSYTAISPYVCMAWVLFKHRNNTTLTFTCYVL